MAKKRIFSIGFSFPGDSAEYVDFSSDQSLLDADIIVYAPSLGDYDSSEFFEGKPCLSESSSFHVRQQILHWGTELRDAVQAGKVVIVYLARPEEVFRYTGNKEYSGTGRNRQTINGVTKISSYTALPFGIDIHTRSGKEIKPAGDLKYLAAYWNEFGKDSPYFITIDGKFTDALLHTQSGGFVVGASVRAKKGAVIFLPPVQYSEDAFTETDDDEEEECWNDEGVAFGLRLASAIVSLVDGFTTDTKLTPAPQWTQHSQFRLPEESEMEKELEQKTRQIERSVKAKRKLEGELEHVGELRRLLYEKGKPLEAVVIEVLKLFGFDAEPFDDGESEFDAVFVSPEGRFLGEAEGKDRRALNIKKFSQLERNIQEDFARDDVDEHAKGVLFGNAFRLQPLAERADAFTRKCVTAAERVGIALVRTADLFEPARYLRTNGDSTYAEACRKAIHDAHGTVVEFPHAPDSIDVETATSKELLVTAQEPVDPDTEDSGGTDDFAE